MTDSPEYSAKYYTSRKVAFERATRSRIRSVGGRRDPIRSIVDGTAAASTSALQCSKAKIICGK